MPRCIIICDMLLLHDALKLEGPLTLMLTGQKDFLVSASAAMGGGPYCSPDAQMHILHMSLHGALMLESSPTLMWTGQRNVLIEDHSVLNIIPKGGPYYRPNTSKGKAWVSWTCWCCMVLWNLKTRHHPCGQGKRMTWWRDLLCSAAMGGGPYCSPDAQMHVLHMWLHAVHGALMLEGSPHWYGQCRRMF